MMSASKNIFSYLDKLAGTVSEAGNGIHDNISRLQMANYTDDPYEYLMTVKQLQDRPIASERLQHYANQCKIILDQIPDDVLDIMPDRSRVGFDRMKSAANRLVNTSFKIHLFLDNISHMQKEDVDEDDRFYMGKLIDSLEKEYNELYEGTKELNFESQYKAAKNLSYVLFGTQGN